MLRGEPDIVTGCKKRMRQEGVQCTSDRESHGSRKVSFERRYGREACVKQKRNVSFGWD